MSQIQCDQRGCGEVIHSKASALNRLMGLHKLKAHGILGKSKAAYYRHKAAQAAIQASASADIVTVDMAPSTAHAKVTQYLEDRIATYAALLRQAKADLAALQSISAFNGGQLKKGLRRSRRLDSFDTLEEAKNARV